MSLATKYHSFARYFYRHCYIYRCFLSSIQKTYQIFWFLSAFKIKVKRHNTIKRFSNAIFYVFTNVDPLCLLVIEQQQKVVISFPYIHFNIYFYNMIESKKINCIYIDAVTQAHMTPTDILLIKNCYIYTFQ